MCIQKTTEIEFIILADFSTVLNQFCCILLSDFQFQNVINDRIYVILVKLFNKYRTAIEGAIENDCLTP